jgi:hypothetical protein
VRKEAVVAVFKFISEKFPGGTEETMKIQRIATFGLRIQIRPPENEEGLLYLEFDIRLLYTAE